MADKKPDPKKLLERFNTHPSDKGNREVMRETFKDERFIRTTQSGTPPVDVEKSLKTRVFLEDNPGDEVANALTVEGLFALVAGTKVYPADPWYGFALLDGVSQVPQNAPAGTPEVDWSGISRDRQLLASYAREVDHPEVRGWSGARARATIWPR